MSRRIDIKSLPSLERLLELLDYNKASGVLTWKTQPKTSRRNIGFNNKCGGAVAGTVGTSGYLVIGISKKYYLAHRIIWKMMTGSDPADQVDHVDADRLNNRWSNLREATNGLNIQNSKMRRDNRSGVKGVHWDKHRNKWRAVITFDGYQHKVGRFNDLKEAASAIAAARTRYHGKFARLA
jgi:hypothetical protein